MYPLLSAQDNSCLLPMLLLLRSFLHLQVLLIILFCFLPYLHCNTCSLPLPDVHLMRMMSVFLHCQILHHMSSHLLIRLLSGYQALLLRYSVLLLLQFHSFLCYLFCLPFLRSMCIRILLYMYLLLFP